MVNLYENKVFFSPDKGSGPSYQSKKDIENLPDYEENFGHMAEAIIRSSIGKKAGLFVEKVETGTKPEDYREKVDFWIKFVGIEEPLGIQYTVSDNEDKVQEKLEFLRSRKFLAKKEKRSDSEIDWSGTANVVLVRGNKLKMAKIYKESAEKQIDPGELVGEEYIRDFFSQVKVMLEEANPLKLKIVFSAIRSAYEKEAGKIKRKGTKSMI